MLKEQPPLEVNMEEKNYDYTGAEVQEIKIDEEFAAEQARKRKAK